MFIAEKYRKTNIVEYVLYMWHIEELIRSVNFDLQAIEETVISAFPLEAEAKVELKQWYKGLIDKMTKEGIRDKGHLSDLSELMVEISYLHHSLMTVFQDKHYQELVSEAQPSLDELKTKTHGEARNEIETAMNGLFGVLLLKLKKREVSEATQEAMKSITQMMAHLAAQYNAMKEGTLSLPKVMEN